MTRTIAARFGLAAGLATLAAAGPAAAVHIRVEATGFDGVGQVVPDPERGVTADTPPIVELFEPLTIFGSVIAEEGENGTRTFTHTYNFGFDTAGPAGASATPNVLVVDGSFQAGFDDFEGALTGPGIDGVLALERPAGDVQTPRINRIAADFAALDTTDGVVPGNPTPYTLTITGSLLPNATSGVYGGNVGVVPLPGAAVLFLTALGGLAFFRRRNGAGAQAAAA